VARCVRFWRFFFAEAERISEQHSKRTADIEYTIDEIKAGFDEIGEKYEFKGLILAVANHDITKVKEIRKEYLYDVLEAVQVKSHLIAAQRRLAKVKK